jgi:hypothetical protein
MLLRTAASRAAAGIAVGGIIGLGFSRHSQCDGGPGKPAPRQARLIFTGTGTSEGIPLVSCLTDPGTPCAVCNDATTPGSKNHRRNTGALIVYDDDLGVQRTVHARLSLL